MLVQVNSERFKDYVKSLRESQGAKEVLTGDVVTLIDCNKLAVARWQEIDGVMIHTYADMTLFSLWNNEDLKLQVAISEVGRLANNRDLDREIIDGLRAELARAKGGY